MTRSAASGRVSVSSRRSLPPLPSRLARVNLFPRGSCAMSFVPGFAPDALSQWRELDFELQELVLDELERLAADPPAAGSADVVDVVREVAGLRHYVFVRFAVDRARQRLIIVGVGRFAPS